jgi:hypothetical protein
MNENQAVCLKCGVPAGAGNRFCPNCGEPVAELAVICPHCGVSLTANHFAASKINTSGIKSRSIVLSIFLTLITCGIYSIYWYVCLTNEMNRASGKVNDTSGGAAVLFTLITCGIYGYFWAYKMGEKRDLVAGENGYSNILYLILTLVGLGIVVYGMAQHTLNEAVGDSSF